jgi:hypothetical protein
MRIISLLCPHISGLSRSPYGTRVVQRIGDVAQTKDQRRIYLNCFKDILVELAKDNCGIHSILKLVDVATSWDEEIIN